MFKKTIAKATAALANIIGHGAKEITPAELIIRSGDRVTRGQKKRLGRAAYDDLVDLGQRTIVLGHIHPRWLRAEVERRLDAGENMNAERVEQLRALGRPLCGDTP